MKHLLEIINIKRGKKMASEEQISRNLVNNGILIGEYEYFPLHSTTIKQYKQTKVIQNKSYGDYENRRPDGLIVDRRNKASLQVIALLEYKKPKDFQTDKQKKDAIEQCNDLCQVLYAKIGIISDGIVTYWINPNNPEKNNEYIDRTNGTKRSYSYILNDDKQKLQKRFHISEIAQADLKKLDDDTKETYQLIERILHETSRSNSILKATEKTDPTALAKSVWQSIYISTKDSPTACLYNVVEIFIFKFLSDLGILKRDYSFDHLIKMYKDDYPENEVLVHYATKSRNKIKELFSSSDDGTGIINGTIFVNSDGVAVSSQSTLFRYTIEKYAKFGDLRNIKKEFKTKLFETFLKQSKDKSRLGQFFTPRKVVKAIVEMADVDKANFICDPFCGVGGFVLEPFQISTNLKNRLIPKNGKIEPHVKFAGYDTGREDSDEQRRTIILAKANMLIYLSDLIEANPTLNKEYEKIINDTFHFLSDSNLGTLNIKFENEEDKPDLILTNPPYITSGMATIRKQVETEGLSEFYSGSGQGVQGLCLKWIISNLKKGGRAFVILPDSTFTVSANNILKAEIKQKCFINCIISLPVKTFFNTPKKTYILGITKKENEDQNQDFPVFTYLVSSIGETLDINRFEIEDNDLDKAKNLFNQYKGSPTNFKIDDPRCKTQQITLFNPEENWAIERLWSKEELISLGIVNDNEVLNVNEFSEMVEDISETLSELSVLLKEVALELPNAKKFKQVQIDEIITFPATNSKITKAFCRKHKGDIPVYASSKDEKSVLGYIEDNIPDVKYYENCLSWNRNGSVGYVFIRNHRFATNEDHRAMVIQDDLKSCLNVKYLKYEIEKKLFENGFSFLDKCGVDKIKKVMINIPVDDSGTFDYDIQNQLAEKYQKINEIKEVVDKELNKIHEIEIDVQ